MDSAATASELMLGELAVCRHRSQPDPCILIGGLGLGFTLQRVLERVGPGAKVRVVELLPEIVRWNREFLFELNGALLNDSRVEILVADVREVIAESVRNRYDAIALDIDNGPIAWVQKSNDRLYNAAGIRSIARALKSRGRAAIWSARQEHSFMQRLVKAGFRVETVPVKPYPQAKRPAYTIYLADQR